MNTNRKHRMLSIVALALACVMLGSGIALGSQSAASAETQTVVLTSPFTAAVAEARPSVVGVNNYQTVRYSNYYDGWGSFFYGYGYGRGRDNDVQTQETLKSTGSGVVVADKYVLTNYHVVEDGTRFTLSIYDYSTDEISKVDAEVVAYDADLDIAVLYAPELTLAPVALGDSDNMQVGDWAICIGNPLGENFFGTVTTGIVSSLNRAISSTSYDKYGRRETKTVQMIQTDAAINSGNSGGGMFNTAGELVGIPARKYSSNSMFSSTSVEGIGMCIPINLAKPMIDDVLSGKIETPEMETSAAAQPTPANDLTGKPRLGVTIKPIAATADGRIPNGVYVSTVDENSPAAAAGMQTGDIIVDVEDNVITTISQLQDVLIKHKEGDVLNVKVFRVPGLAELPAGAEVPDNGKYIDLKVKLAIVDAVAQ